MAETEEDLRALVLASAERSPAPVSLVIPTRQASFFRWCLDEGLRVIKPMQQRLNQIPFIIERMSNTPYFLLASISISSSSGIANAPRRSSSATIESGPGESDLARMRDPSWVRT